MSEATETTFVTNPNPAIPLANGTPMDMAKLLAEVAAGKITADDAAKLLSKPTGKLYCKVSQKGALSLYGLQRMPVTLYAAQWERLLSLAPEIVKVIGSHKELNRKAA